VEDGAGLPRSRGAAGRGVVGRRQPVAGRRSVCPNQPNGDRKQADGPLRTHGQCTAPRPASLRAVPAAPGLRLSRPGTSLRRLASPPHPHPPWVAVSRSLGGVHPAPTAGRGYEGRGTRDKGQGESTQPRKMCLGSASAPLTVAVRILGCTRSDGARLWLRVVAARPRWPHTGDHVYRLLPDSQRAPALITRQG
jgi:hypothetical protein